MTSLKNYLVLHQFLCREFGYRDLNAMLSRLQDVSPQSSPNGQTEYFRALYINPEHANIDLNQFISYDNEIAELSGQLRMTDEGGRVWKPHQYLAVLFTEHYLNRYFDNPEWLLDDLNEAKRRNRKTQTMADYTVENLRTIAVQSATGSGKTLIMHANVLQYRRIASKAGKLLNNVILLTPNEQMSEQHYRDLSDSSLHARLFSSETDTDLFASIEIVDLNKLAEKKG